MARVACVDDTSNAEIKALADRIRAGRGARLPDFYKTMVSKTGGTRSLG